MTSRLGFGECTACGAGLPGMVEHQEFCWVADPSRPNLGCPPNYCPDCGVDFGANLGNHMRGQRCPVRASGTPGDDKSAGVPEGRPGQTSPGSPAAQPLNTANPGAITPGVA